MGEQYAQKYWLTTWVNNEKAIGFYKYIGFSDIGIIFFDLDGEKHENRVLAYNPLK